MKRTVEADGVDPYRLVRRFEKVKRCQVLRLFENATVALSCATDWILVVVGTLLESQLEEAATTVTQQ